MERFIVDVLATERLTRLVVEDEITTDLRYRVMGMFPDSKISYLVNCPYCVSVWAGGAVALAKKSVVGRGLVYALALSQATIHLKELKDG